MVSTEVNNITEDETTLYDRQLRCWGVEGQKRLRSTKLLIVGMDCLIAEVCKNIVLAGINSLTVCNTGDLSKEEFDSNFLGRGDDGKVSMDVFLTRLRKMNPNVQLSEVEKKVQDLTEDFLKTFTVILITNANKGDIIRINDIAKKNNIKFYCADTYGGAGFYFVDLNEHKFVLEQTIKKPAKKPVIGVKRGRDEVNSTHTNGSGDAKKDESKEEIITTYVEKHESYVPFEKALNTDLSKFSNLMKKKQWDPTYLLVKTILQFREKHNRNPRSESREEDLKALEEIRSQVLQETELPEETYPLDLVQGAFGKSSPVCAIVGGSLAQEIIHGISANQKPHKNMFFFNFISCAGNVYDMS